ncbi:hypothetical protein L6270_00515 [Candidatus Parcubacteria bacterium]|nr:hypothetical protein [Patescibacteria group bacterium]MBU4309632.1 hypothetical protein [Patescibacteria group bacterium]MBU4432563.1 hypothetical protein [Patescibacteria group bacterium]MBU4577980.1 hypothetical protein [Patescibacteria group bacterium]MCG2696511.1 hypothetical protein [Candidatus Parcubacteria bacterium]
MCENPEDDGITNFERELRHTHQCQKCGNNFLAYQPGCPICGSNAKVLSLPADLEKGNYSFSKGID